MTVQSTVSNEPRPRTAAPTKMEPSNAQIAVLLDKHPEYRKTLALAIAYEEGPHAAKGWQWHDVETHPTKLIRLVTEGITMIHEKSRQATRYRLRDRKTVKESLTHCLR